MALHTRVARALAFLAVSGGLLTMPTPAHAQGDFGVRGGVYTEESDGFVGLEFVRRLRGSQWFFNPNLETVFVDNGDLWTVNADFHYELPTSGQFDIWLGGGPAVLFHHPDRGSRSTDAALNLLAGIGFSPHNPVRPYVQGKVIVSDKSEAVFGFGLRF
jgi:hypothetical protein